MQKLIIYILYQLLTTQSSHSLKIQKKRRFQTPKEANSSINKKSKINFHESKARIQKMKKNKIENDYDIYSLPDKKIYNISSVSDYKSSYTGKSKALQHRGPNYDSTVKAEKASKKILFKDGFQWDNEPSNFNYINEYKEYYMMGTPKMLGEHDVSTMKGKDEKKVKRKIKMPSNPHVHPYERVQSLPDAITRDWEEDLTEAYRRNVKKNN